MALTERAEATLRTTTLRAGMRVEVVSSTSHHWKRQGTILRFLVSHDGKTTWAEIKPDCCQPFLEEIVCLTLT